MESFLSDKPESMIIRALQWLLPALISNWGDLDAFRRAGTPGFMREAGIPRGDAVKAVGVVDQAFRQATRIQAQQFRPLKKQEDLEYAYTRLVPSVTDSSARQGFLWLAYQAQSKAIDFLQSDKGKNVGRNLAKAVEENKNIFVSLSEDAESLNLAKIERILMVLGRKSLGEEAGNFELSMVTGAIIEFARAEGRSVLQEDLLTSRHGAGNEDKRLLLSVVDPVHLAELNEANNRFLRLDDGEKGRWFDRLRGFLNRNATSVATSAPKGYEAFCLAVEGMLFPYPAQLEWMRAYLKPLYTNAQQSSTFDNCVTEASITQRYKKMMAESSPNKTMIELARSFALVKLNMFEEPEQREFLDGLNLREEFQWPASLAELKAQQSA